MSKVGQILNPVLADLSGIEEAILLTHEGYYIYNYKNDHFKSTINPNFLRTLLITVQGLAGKLKEEPRFFLGEMQKKNFAIIFFDQFSFIMLLNNIEEVGYIRLQLEELRGKLEDSINEIKKNISLDVEEDFKIPTEGDIEKILKEFSFVES